nr:hypothetical protein [Tanacetum cinerariifolium]
GNFLWAVGKFLLPVENFLLTGGTYLLAVDTHGALYELFTADELRKVQILGSGISIPLAVGTPSTGSGNLYCQWEHPPLAVGTYTASRNSLLAVGMPCTFYSQH